MSDKSYRTHTTILGQHLWSPRFEKKSQMKEWLQTIADARKNIVSGKDLSAEQRHILTHAGFEFQSYEGDIYLSELAAPFLRMRADEYVSSTALPNMQHLRKYILPKFGHRNVYSIGSSEIRNFLRNLKERKFKGYLRDDKGKIKHPKEPEYEDSEKPLSQATKDRIKVTFSLLFDYAIEEEIVGESFVNPVPKSKRRGSRQASTDEKIKFWEDEEDIEAFLEVCHKRGPFSFAFMTTKINTGLRKGEMLALTWEDVDFKGRRIAVSKILEQNSLQVVKRTKSGKDKVRFVSMNDAVRDALWPWRDETKFKKPTDFVFPSEDGSYYSPRDINDLFSEIATEANVDDITPHGLRHTYATHYIINGGRVEDLKEDLGHGSITTTMKYVHLVRKLKKVPKHVVSFSFGKGVEK